MLRAVAPHCAAAGHAACGGDAAFDHQTLRGEGEQGDCSLAAVGDVACLAGATDVEAVGTLPGPQECGRGQGAAVEHPEAGCVHVGDVPGSAVGGDFHV